MSAIRDVDVGDMVIYMAFLDDMPPITSELDRWGSPFNTQKEHMMDWLLHQPVGGGSGRAFSYTRRVGNTSTRTMYNRFMNPGGLLWMAEGFGVEETALRKAVDAAVEAGKVNYRNRCTAFREVVPFDVVMDAFNNPQGWKLDSYIATLLWYDDNGFPNISPEDKWHLFDGSGLTITALHARRKEYAIAAFEKIAKPKPKQ